MTNSRERDRSIERLLRQSRPVPQAPVKGALTDSCLDPETLAAWADGGLSGDLRQGVQSHVADCARCQALVGTLARIDRVIPATESKRAASGWVQWLAPLGAAAAVIAAVTVWVTVPRNSDVQRQTKEETRAPVTAPSVSGTSTTVAAGASGVSGRAEQPAEARGNNEPQPQADLGAAAARVPASPGSNYLATGAAAKSGLAAGKQPGAEAIELRRDAGRLEAANAKEPPGSPAPAAAAAPLLDKAAAPARPTLRATEAAGVEIVSSDPAVRWRIAGSAVQRSTNGGSTWQAVATGFTGQLTAGAAPSPSVCWLVGRGGFMLLATVTTSGVSSRRVPFPEPTDLSAVRATDARTASATSVDGRTFSTTDGGATWVLVTPQDF